MRLGVGVAPTAHALVEVHGSTYTGVHATRADPLTIRHFSAGLVYNRRCRHRPVGGM